MPYINKGSSLKGVSANDHSRFDLHCEGAKNTDGRLHACIRIINRVRDHFVTGTQGHKRPCKAFIICMSYDVPCKKWPLTNGRELISVDQKLEICKRLKKGATITSFSKELNT